MNYKTRRTDPYDTALGWMVLSLMALLLCFGAWAVLCAAWWLWGAA